MNEVQNSQANGISDEYLQQIGQIPLNLELQDELCQRVLEQFDYLNDNSFLIVDKLNELLNESYQINTQLEQLSFNGLNQSITALIEKVELNPTNGEQTLIMAVLQDILLKFQNRQRIPGGIQNLRQFATSDNSFTIRVKNISYNGLETFAFMLVLEKLYDIRESFKDTFGDRFEIIKNESVKFRSISDDDVWFTHAQVIDENTIDFNFMFISFEIRQQLVSFEKMSEDHLNQISQMGASAIVEQDAWYGTKRYDIVDHVLRLQEQKDKLAQKSAVQEAALRAQQPFQTQTMKDIEKNFEGPPKYLNQRDSPLEIPIEIVKIFMTTVDLDMDDRVSADELYAYAQKKYLPFERDVVYDMFREASSGRGIIHQKQREAPLTLDEISAAVRGRHRWNTETKAWEVNYRQYRDYWIIFLQTINERIFAMPVPKVAPTKILAQFEEEDLKKTIQFKKPEGMDKKYMSIRDQRLPTYQKDLYKTEGGINPEGTIRIQDKKQKKVEQNPYVQQINARMNGASETTHNGYPKVTFEAKELFNQATILSQVIPHWTSDKENPIYQYVPTSERPFTNDADAAYNFQQQQKQMYQSQRETKFQELQSKERTLQLAGTMALKNRKTSPWRVMKERQGFVTKFKVPTILDQKMNAQLTQKNQIDDKTGTFKPIQDPYMPPSDHKFRDLEIPRGQKDFTLRYKCPPAYNTNGVSEHDLRPKEVLEKQRRMDETQKLRAKQEYEGLLKGINIDKKKSWIYYHSLPDKLVPVSHQLSDKFIQKEKNPFLDKEEFTPAYLQLARQMKDDVVFGKPNFNLYFKSLKPVDLNEEFGGVKTKPYKVIY